MKQKRIALLLAFVLLFSCLSGCAGGKATVTTALARSAKAYSELWKGLRSELPFDAKNGYRQDAELLLAELPGSASALNGAMTLLLSSAAAGEDAPRESAASLMLGELAFFSFTGRTEGNLCYITCPLLLGDICLGVDLNTLPADLRRFGLTDLPEALTLPAAAAMPSPQLSFTEGESAALLNVGKSLLKDIAVKRSGKEERSVNGHNTTCQLYTVTLPAADVISLFDALRSPLQRMLENGSITLHGVAQDLTPRELMDELRGFVTSVGDLMLTLGIADKRLALAEAEITGTLRGKTVTLCPGLQLGGGSVYTDDLSLSLSAATDGGEPKTILWRSHGDHSGRSGTYTDESALVLYGNEEGALKLTCSFAPRQEQDNLHISLGDGNGTRLSCDGTLHCTAQELSVQNAKVSLASGEKLLGLDVDYRLGAYEELAAHPEKPLLFSTLNDGELQSLVTGVFSRLQMALALFSGI